MQTDRRKTRIEKKEEHKKRIMAAKPNLILSLIVATLVTIACWYKSVLPIGIKLDNWAIFGIYAGIFVFAFGFTFLLNNWRRYKKRFALNKYSIFAILSLIMSALATYASEGTWINFIIGFGCCYAIFFMFWKLDYDNIKHNFFQFFKSLAYGIIYPSMFLIIALMGVIDKNNMFMSKVIPSLTAFGEMISNALINIVQVIYALGKYEYSLVFLIAIFIFLVFFAIYDFLKKTMPLKGEKLK